MEDCECNHCWHEEPHFCTSSFCKARTYKYICCWCGASKIEEPEKPKHGNCLPDYMRVYDNDNECSGYD